MNILYLLGNGFDKNLGMKTSYTDFYKAAYRIKKSDKEVIQDLKQSILMKVENWSDLELGLGKYTTELTRKEDFYTIFDDLRDKLTKYIANQESSIPVNESIKNKILENMKSPYDLFEEGGRQQFNDFISKFSYSEVSIRAITFNYTRSLDMILDYDPEAKIKVEDSGKIPVYFKSIEHIHGYTNNRFILGVDNIMQIENESFRADEDVVNAFVKPTHNVLSQQLVDVRCRNLIKEAQIICLFGLSLGETDKTWWELIANRLKGHETRLIIFWYGNEAISSQFLDTKFRMVKKVKDLFLSKTSLSKNEKESILNYIHVVYNSDMFNIEALKIENN